MISGEVSRYTSARSDKRGLDLEPAVLLQLAGDEGAATLLGFEDAVARQQIDRLADRDPRDAEFRGEQLRLPAAASPAPRSRARSAAERCRRSGHISARGCRKSDPCQILDRRRRMPRRTAIYDITSAAPLSPIIRLLALVLAEVICGITEASITRSRVDAADAQLRIEHRCPVASHPAGADAMKHRPAGGAREIPQAGGDCRPLRRAPSRDPRGRGMISAGRSRATSSGPRRWSCGRFPRRSSSARCAAVERIDRTDGELPRDSPWHCQTER